MKAGSKRGKKARGKVRSGPKQGVKKSPALKVLSFLCAHEKATVALLILIFLLQGATSNLTKSVTYDEHSKMLLSGRNYLVKGRFVGAYIDNPPLLKVIGSSIALLADPSLMVDVNYDNEREFSNNALFWARMFILVLGCAGGALLFAFTKRIYGVEAGFISLFLYCFSPTVLAHASLFTVDYGSAFFFLAVIFLFEEYLRKPSPQNQVKVGVVLGLAQLVKFNLVLLYPILIILFCAIKYPLVLKAPNSEKWLFALRSAMAIGLIFAISLLVLNVGYLFHGSMWPLNHGVYVKYGFKSSFVQSFAQNDLINWVPLPLPAYYVVGIDFAKMNMERGMSHYFMGLKSRGGWWNYFLVAWLVKTPIPLQIIFIWALLWGLTGSRKERKDLLMFIPLVVVVVWMSILNRMNYGIKYMLPAYPFIFAYCGRVVESLKGGSRKLSAVFLALCILYMSSTLLSWPHHLEYFNSIAGGPDNGHKYLLDSNLDWGQNKFFIQEYKKDRNVVVDPYCLFAEGTMALGVNYANDLFYMDMLDCHTWLTRNYPVTEKVAHTWWIYEVPPPIDHLDLGSMHVDTYASHSVDCHTMCDDSREDLILVVHGNISFTLETDDKTDNSIIFDVWDNYNCRLMEIYIDGDHVGYLKGAGKRPGWFSYSLPVQKSHSSDGKITVMLTHKGNTCAGWDVSDVRTVHRYV